jgi:hypothetical protein
MVISFPIQSVFQVDRVVYIADVDDMTAKMMMVV